MLLAMISPVLYFLQFVASGDPNLGVGVNLMSAFRKPLQSCWFLAFGDAFG
jgi:hypothetical protein